MSHHDDTIRISYIGDSWAEMHKNIDCVIDSLVSDAIGSPVVVKTAGISGLTSKYIYNCIFRNDSMRNVIKWGPDFCFLVAGINDSDRKMGKKYYKENMRLILELLLENHITPVVLEIPSYDIRFSYQRRNRQIKFQYLVSMLLTWSKMDCIQDYRDAYNDLIKEEKWECKVITISYKDWNPEGYKDKRGLYDGGLMHLNAKGYSVLDSCISQKIIEFISDSSNSGNR
jgi:lysophospholipase L1-like esterase